MKRFTFVTLALTAVIAFLVGAIVAGGISRSAVSAGVAGRPAARPGLMSTMPAHAGSGAAPARGGRKAAGGAAGQPFLIHPTVRGTSALAATVTAPGADPEAGSSSTSMAAS